MRRRWIGCLFAATALVFTSCTSSSTTPASGSGGFHVKGGLDTVPAAAKINGTVLPDALKKFIGKPLVINFFSSTCVACKTELPALAAAHTTLGDTVTFVGVATVDLPEEARKIATSAGVTYEIVDDPTGDLLAAFGGASLPATAFVSPDGTIRSVQLRALDTEHITQLIKETLNT